MSPLLEVIALDVDDAQRAADGGADRVEICADIAAEGLTPNEKLLEEVLRRDLPLGIMVMIRPRDGYFVYRPDELEIMEREIRRFREMGIDGVVFGCLTQEGNVDETALRHLVAAAKPLSVTFHRAFDSVSNRKEALEVLVRVGVDRVLTFGYPCGFPRQRTDIRAVLEMGRLAAGRISLMTGGWLEKTEISALLLGGVNEFHFGRAVRKHDDYASPVDPSRVREWKALLSHRR